MKYKQNLHIHSTFCDGADTPEEMVNEAIAQGFDSIGFSGHSWMPFSPNPNRSMSPQEAEEYKKEVTRLKGVYADKIKVFLGLEVEMHSIPHIDMSGYDYLIGSAHYFDFDGQKVGFDRGVDEVKRIIDTYFDGDGLRFAKAYYKLLAELPDKGDFQIVGHFDLAAKLIEKADLFDEDCKEYRFAAIEAAEALAGKIPFFEVNTGAMARGHRTSPYPRPFIVKELKRLGFGAMISSDCHDKKNLSCGYGLAAEILKDCGYKEIYVLTEDGFVPKGL